MGDHSMEAANISNSSFDHSLTLPFSIVHRLCPFSAFIVSF